MKKNFIITIVLIVLIIINIGLGFNYTSKNSVSEPIVSTPVLENVVYLYDTPTTLDEVYEVLSLIGARKNMATQIYDNLLLLDYPETHPAVIMIKNNINKMQDDYLYYQDIYKNLEQEEKWKVRMNEYPTATQIWLYMKNNLEWNDYVCAGVMGNMMAECGGQTLKLNPKARNKSSNCYGICQWHPKYFPDMQDASLEEQLKFLGISTKKTFNGWAGKAYGYDYDEFISLEDSEIAAEIFCMVYERPGKYDSQRSKNAIKAYEYFTN